MKGKYCLPSATSFRKYTFVKRVYTTWQKVQVKGTVPTTALADLNLPTAITKPVSPEGTHVEFQWKRLFILFSSTRTEGVR